MAAYREALPAKGFSNGFNSCAPEVVMACRVDHASKVAAPCDAIASLFQRRMFRRFSARNVPTDTVMGLPGLRKAMGAGELTARADAGASGRAAGSDIVNGCSGAATVAAAGGKEFSLAEGALERPGSAG